MIYNNPCLFMFPGPSWQQKHSSATKIPLDSLSTFSWFFFQIIGKFCLRFFRKFAKVWSRYKDNPCKGHVRITNVLFNIYISLNGVKWEDILFYPALPFKKQNNILSSLLVLSFLPTTLLVLPTLFFFYHYTPFLKESSSNFYRGRVQFTQVEMIPLV